MLPTVNANGTFARIVSSARASATPTTKEIIITATTTADIFPTFSLMTSLTCGRRRHLFGWTANGHGEFATAGEMSVTESRPSGSRVAAAPLHVGGAGGACLL